MSALFFGPAARQRFGYHHAGRGTSAGAVVICPSWGPEYQYAHRALRVTARRLAERGFHVLRFDYSGVGDSWGDTTDGDIDLWQEDIALAIHEIQALSGHRRVDVVALRVGAFVAAAASASRSDVRRIVLWDPVVDGAAWTGGFRTSPLAGRNGRDGEQAVEFAQRLVSVRLLRQFAAIDAAHYSPSSAEAVLLLRTDSNDGQQTNTPLEHLGEVQHAFVEDASPWLEDESIWSGLVPAKAVRAIVDWLARP